MADRLDTDQRLLLKIAQALAAGGIPAAVQAALNLKEDLANKSPDVNLGNSDTLYPTQNAVREYANAVELIAQAYTNELTVNHEALTQASPTVVDFLGAPYRTITMTGDITLESTNRVAAHSVVIRLIAGASSRNLTFPAGWIFVGAAAPTSLAANKEAILSITAFGANEADVRAAYSAQP